jgi:hypothetical protein
MNLHRYQSRGWKSLRGAFPALPRNDQQAHRVSATFAALRDRNSGELLARNGDCTDAALIMID